MTYLWHILPYKIGMVTKQYLSIMLLHITYSMVGHLHDTYYFFSKET